MTRARAAVALILVLMSAPASAQQPSDPRAAALVGLARTRQALGDTRGAAGFFRLADQRSPLSGTLLEEWFWLEVAVTPSDALPVARRLLMARPGLRDVRQRMVDEAAAAGEHEAADELARAGTVLEPEAIEWPRGLARAADARGDAREALAIRIRAATLASAEDEDFAALAGTAEGLGDTRRAVDAWHRIDTATRDAVQAWSTGYVRSLATSGASLDSAVALDRHVARYGENDGLRSIVVDTLARDGHFHRALALVAPLIKGADRVTWLARSVEFAVASGDPARTIEAVTALASHTTLSLDQLSWRADALLSLGRVADARPDIDQIMQRGTTCEARGLTLLERAGDGPTLAAAVLGRPSCGDEAQWRIRAAHLVLGSQAESHLPHLLGPLEASGRLSPEDSLMYGQALTRLHRTGDALSVLTPLLDQPAVSRDATTALVELHLREGNPVNAWRLAADTLPTQADLRPYEHWLRAGIDAGRATDVLEMLSSRRGTQRAALALVEASALAAAGRPTEAVAVFGRLNPANVDAASDALRFIDAVSVVDGVSRARVVAETFTSHDLPWIEVVARRALLAVRDGDPEAGRRLRAVVSRLDATRATLLDAEVALAEGRPEQSLVTLEGILDGAPGDRRALELRVASYGALGRWSLALADTATLRSVAPTPTLDARAAEYAWRDQPAPERLQSFLEAARVAGTPEMLTAAARALREVGRPAEATVWFGPETAWRELDVARRTELALTLEAQGRSLDALSLLEHDATADTGLQLVRARVMAAVRGPQAASHLFSSLASSADATPAVFDAWARIESGRPRTRILAAAVAAFPSSPDLLMAAARDHVAGAEWASAASLLERARAIAPDRLDAWTASFDVALRRGRRDDVARLLADADTHSGEHPGLRRDLTLHLSGLLTGTNDLMASTLLAWADESVSSGIGGQRYLTRARVHAALERWAGAIDDLTQAVADPATTREATRLRADVLSYAGRYREAIEAYDSYLSAFPDDLEAARQRARVFGWAQRFDDARAAYTALGDAHPTDAHIRAEADAKSAMFDARWSEARRAYVRWLSIEPGNEEAAFELAQTTRALGLEGDAIRQIAPLAARQPAHRQSGLAIDTWRAARAPSAQPYSLTRHAAGEGGRRTLSLEEAGVAGGAWLSSPGRLWVGLRAGRMAAGSPQGDLVGSRVAAVMSARIARVFVTDGSLGRTELGAAVTPTFEFGTRLAMTDRASLAVRTVRQAWLENPTTAHTGLTTTDLRASADLVHPRWSLASSVRRRRFSDDNSTWMADSTARVQLMAGRTEWHAFGWTAQENAQRESDVYFAPRRFTRADLGLEWRRWLSPPRFRDDRERSLTAAYAVGIDSRQFVYHRPSVRLAYEVRRGVAVEARGAWVRSPAFRSTDVMLVLRVGGAVPAPANPLP